MNLLNETALIFSEVQIELSLIEMTDYMIYGFLITGIVIFLFVVYIIKNSFGGFK